MVFNDASRLNIGEREGLGKVFDATCLYDFLLVDFTVEINDGAVGLYRARPDVMNVPPPFEDGNFHVRIFTSFLGEYFLAHVVVLVGRRGIAIVTVHLAVENDRWSARRFRLADHL